MIAQAFRHPGTREHGPIKLLARTLDCRIRRRKSSRTSWSARAAAARAASSACVAACLWAVPCRAASSLCAAGLGTAPAFRACVMLTVNTTGFQPVRMLLRAQPLGDCGRQGGSPCRCRGMQMRKLRVSLSCQG